MTNLLPCVVNSVGMAVPAPAATDLTDLRGFGTWDSESTSDTSSAETTAVARIFSLALYPT